MALTSLLTTGSADQPLATLGLPMPLSGRQTADSNHAVDSRNTPAIVNGLNTSGLTPHDAVFPGPGGQSSHPPVRFNTFTPAVSPSLSLPASSLPAPAAAVSALPQPYPAHPYPAAPAYQPWQPPAPPTTNLSTPPAIASGRIASPRISTSTLPPAAVYGGDPYAHTRTYDAPAGQSLRLTPDRWIHQPFSTAAASTPPPPELNAPVGEISFADVFAFSSPAATPAMPPPALPPAVGPAEAAATPRSSAVEASVGRAAASDSLAAESSPAAAVVSQAPAVETAKVPASTAPAAKREPAETEDPVSVATQSLLPAARPAVDATNRIADLPELPLPAGQTNDTSSANAQRSTSDIRQAAMRLRALQGDDTPQVPLQTDPIMPGYSVPALRRAATTAISEAQVSLDARAYLTAEERAIAALELIAQSIDSRERSSLATRDLKISLTAIREAEDFVGKYGLVDGPSISRMVRSHSTSVLKPYDNSRLNGLAAADVYLDWARRCVSPIAAADPLGSEALRILAHSHRLRDEGTPFGTATAVHLMRAAVDANPSNAKLYDDYESTLQLAGLSDHAQIIQARHQHSGMQPSGGVRGQMIDGQAIVASHSRTREAQIMEVTPQQFATLSPALSGPSGQPYYQSTPQPVPAQLAGARMPAGPAPQSAAPPAGYQSSPQPTNNGLLVDPAGAQPAAPQPGVLNRALGPISRILR